jgi:hypothetical protein
MFLLSESPGHRAALLNRHVDAVAIGAARSQHREGPRTIIQGIYFCMAFIQANDLELHARLQAAREHEQAEGEPGGEHLYRARLQAKQGKVNRALQSYRTYLEEMPDSPHVAMVQQRIEELQEQLDQQPAPAARNQRSRWLGKLQGARSFVSSHRPDLARKWLEELLEGCPDPELRAEAQSLLDSLSR